MNTWRDAVLHALTRYYQRHQTRLIERQILIQEELGQIAHDTRSTGLTPAQTLSRILQELRDESILYFTENGKYFLLDSVYAVGQEDLPDDAIDFALQCNKLEFNEIETDESIVMKRQRKGQQRLRQLTLENYGNRCAFCDVGEQNLLVASHIARWSDLPEARGNLTNLICMCSFHDRLFEEGYIALTDDYKILKKPYQKSRVISQLLEFTTHFRLPRQFLPNSVYLQHHRQRTNFST